MVSIWLLKGMGGVATTVENLADNIKLRSICGSAYFTIQNEAGNVILTGQNVKDVQIQWEEDAQAYSVLLYFDEEGTEKFEEATRIAYENNNAPLKICVNDEVISAPHVQAVISDGEAMISGGFSKESADRLYRSILSGVPEDTINF